MNKIRFVVASSLFLAGVYATQVQAATFNFNCITSNGTGSCATAEAQMLLAVTATVANQVLFEFSNNDVGAETDLSAIIGEVYFYDGKYIEPTAPPTILNGAGINFVDGASPANLPGYNSTPLSVFAAADVNKNTADGVAVGDGTLGILFNLLPGEDINTVIAAIDNGDLVIGIHAKAIGVDGISESLITTVPVPAAAWLFGFGLIGLVVVARRRPRS